MMRRKRNRPSFKGGEETGSHEERGKVGFSIQEGDKVMCRYQGFKSSFIEIVKVNGDLTYNVKYNDGDTNVKESHITIRADNDEDDEKEKEEKKKVEPKIEPKKEGIKKEEKKIEEKKKIEQNFIILNHQKMRKRRRNKETR